MIRSLSLRRRSAVASCAALVTAAALAVADSVADALAVDGGARVLELVRRAWLVVEPAVRAAPGDAPALARLVCARPGVVFALDAGLASARLACGISALLEGTVATRGGVDRRLPMRVTGHYRPDHRRWTLIMIRPPTGSRAGVVAGQPPVDQEAGDRDAR